MFKHVGSNWSLIFLKIAVMMLLTPLMQHDEHGVGGPAFGVFQGIVALVGFIDLLALGVPMATVKHVAEGVASGDHERTNRAFSTSLGITLAMGVIALVVGAALFLPFDERLGMLVAEDASLAGSESDARLTYAIVALHAALAFSLRLPYALFDAHHDFSTKNLITASGLLLRVVLVVGLLAVYPSIVVLGTAVATCTLFECLLCAVVVRRRYPEVRPSPRYFDRSVVRATLGFSVFAALANVGSMLAFRLDAVVIGAGVAAERASAEVTAYVNGAIFFDPLISLMIGIGTVVMPTATKLAAAGRRDELLPIVERWLRIGLSIQLLVGGYLMWFGPEFVGRWIAPEYERWSGPVTRILAASFIVFLPVRAVGLSALLGLGNVRGPALGLLVMGLANLVISVALVGSYGIFGVAIGTAVPNVLYAAWLMRELCLELGTPARKVLGDLVRRMPLGLVPPVLVAIALDHFVSNETWLEVLGTGALWTAAFVLSWGLYVYRGDAHLDLRAAAGRLRARLGGRDDA